MVQEMGIHLDLNAKIEFAKSACHAAIPAGTDLTYRMDAPDRSFSSAK